MRKLSSIAVGMFLIFGLILVNNSYAYDIAKLQMKISGVKNNIYYLCVSNSAGCTSIAAANSGKAIPVDTGNINYIFAANPYNKKMYPQPLPSSCRVILSKDQTLIIKGNLVVKKIQRSAETNVQINHMHCVIT